MRPVPPQVLVLGGIASVQFGAAIANKLFAQAGPGGVVLLRLALSAVMLMVAVARPSAAAPGRLPGAVLGFGLILGSMNWSFYEALDRLPLGVAVTIEFTGPLAVAIGGSRRALDGVWVLLAGGGVVLLALRGDNHDVTAFGVVLALIAAALLGRLHPHVASGSGRTWAQLDGLALALCVGDARRDPGRRASRAARRCFVPAVLAGGAAVAICCPRSSRTRSR